MTFEFGMVVGMDFVPELRLMLVAPAVGIKGVRAGVGNWLAVVLRDESVTSACPWTPGQLITLSGVNTGITIFDTPEGSE